MIIKQFIKECSEWGALLIEAHKSLCPLVFAQLVGENALLFVELPGLEMQDAHVLRFATIKPDNENGLQFMDADGNRLAYLAKLDEWPEINSDDYDLDRAEWQAAHSEEQFAASIATDIAKIQS